jgi:hypothetical protein
MPIEIKVNNTVVYTVSDLDIMVLKDAINSNELSAVMGSRLASAIAAKTDQIAIGMFKKWLYGGLLAANGITEVPLNKEDLLQLIFAQPNYKDRAARDAEQELPE